MEKEAEMKMANTMRKLLKQRFCWILALLLIVFTVSAAAEEKNEAETWLALARDAHEQEEYELPSAIMNRPRKPEARKASI